MLNLFTSSKKRMERRLIKQCLNSEKPARWSTMNVLGTPPVLVQPVAKFDDAAPMVRNLIGSPGASAGDTLFVAGKKGR